MIIGVISAFIATVGFSILFHVPKEELFFCGCIGALGWLVYLLSVNFGASAVVANFIAALVISQGSSFLARVRKIPVTILLIPGIIPIVPGAATYQTMYSLLIGEYLDALSYATYTFQVAAVIAGAIALIAMIPRILGINNK